MKSLNFNDGSKEFMINNDPTRIIRFNPADIGFMERARTATKNIETAINSIPDEVPLNADGTVDETIDEFEFGANIIRDVGDTIHESIDYLLASDGASKIALGKQSPLATVGKGKSLVESFLECVIPEIEKEIKASEKASRKRTDKYTKAVKK